MTRLSSLLSACALACLSGPVFAAAGEDMPSDFGCSNFEFNPALQAVEGDEGVFYRTFADLRLQHPMTEATVEQLGRLSDALAAHGTTLVYLVVPPKSAVMPDDLPPRAMDYGFDPAISHRVYEDIVTRLEARGIVAPDLLTALSDDTGAEPGRLPFYGDDFHWTSEGARRGALAVGERIKALPVYADLVPKAHETVEKGEETAFSGMRRQLQSHCTLTLPHVTSMGYLTSAVAGQDGSMDIFATGNGAADADAAVDIFAGPSPEAQADAEEAAGADAGAPVDIFAAGSPAADASTDIFASGGGEAAPGPDIALIGTSFSDNPIANFAGFLAQDAELDVVNYAITGGNQFGAVVSYLTSEEFARSRPRILVWENPIYNNLAQYGPDAMEELIAAANASCDTEVPGTVSEDGTFVADLTGLALEPDDVLLATSGGGKARTVKMTFTAAGGIERDATIERGDRLRASGRFFKPLATVFVPDLQTLSLRFDRPAPEASLHLCSQPKKEDL